MISPGRRRRLEMLLDKVDREPESLVDGGQGWEKRLLAFPQSRTQTLNTHSLHLLAMDDSFCAVTLAAETLSIDGWPVRLWFRASGHRRKLFTGSDLCARLVAGQFPTSLRRFALVGEDNQVGDRLAQTLAASGRSLVYRNHGSLLELSAVEAWGCELTRSTPDIVLVALGLPTAEVIADRVHHLPGSGLVVQVGAGLRMSLGIQRRAPRILRGFGLEWAWRLVQDPRRLWHRYLVDCLPLVLRDLPATTGRQRASVVRQPKGDPSSGMAARDV